MELELWGVVVGVVGGVDIGDCLYTVGHLVSEEGNVVDVLQEVGVVEYGMGQAHSYFADAHCASDLKGVELAVSSVVLVEDDCSLNDLPQIIFYLSDRQFLFLKQFVVEEGRGVLLQNCYFLFLFLKLKSGNDVRVLQKHGKVDVDVDAVAESDVLS